MATSIDWDRPLPAPAKINLFLHVVGRRADGYHLLQTAFRFLDFADYLSFSPRADGCVELLNPLPGIPPERDLCARAAHALASACGVDRGVAIRLDKRIPMGGGLGGGSSDAATTLLALNRLWRCGLTNAELQGIALTLGADVPVFIHGHSAFAEGIGERFTDITPQPAWYLVLTPPVAVPTAQVFADPGLRRDNAPISPVDWSAGSVDFGGNDLEAVACRLYPQVERHLQWLRQWRPARMSGSGACCFAAFDHEAAARAVLAGLPGDMQGFVAPGVDVHPLAENSGLN